MARLKRSQISSIEYAVAYPRGYGYVLDFSDRTMKEFFEEEFGVDIYSAEYQAHGTSKRSRLSAFLMRTDSSTALRVLRALWERREGLLQSLPNSAEAQSARAKTKAFQQVIESLKEEPTPLTMEGVEAFAPDNTLEELVSSIDRSLAANKPQAAIDHLHTYCMKKFAHLLKARGLTCNKDEPLHSRFSRYRKCLEKERQLHEFTSRALKTFTSLLESFNDLRNNRSLAHDNELLAPMEARFIFSSVGAMLVMLRAIESERYGA